MHWINFKTMLLSLYVILRDKRGDQNAEHKNKGGRKARIRRTEKNQKKSNKGVIAGLV